MLPPRLISFPIVDQDALEQEVTKYQTDAAEGYAEVRTRSQAMLEDAITKATWLEEELSTMRKNRMRFEGNLKSLGEVHDTMKIAENDVNVELNAVNQIIALLKAGGVTLS
jgi:hypothetical protein